MSPEEQYSKLREKIDDLIYRQSRLTRAAEAIHSEIQGLKREQGKLQQEQDKLNVFR